MSHASGKVIFKDGTERFAEYNGTGDYMYNLTYETTNERNDKWRQPGSEPDCKHEHVEDVILQSSYGCGMTWKGKCCKDCGWIIEGTDPYADDTLDELHYDEKY